MVLKYNTSCMFYLLVNSLMYQNNTFKISKRIYSNSGLCAIFIPTILIAVSALLDAFEVNHFYFDIAKGGSLVNKAIYTY